MSLNTLTFSTLLIVFPTFSYSIELSLITGLNVFHASESKYRDYRQQPTETGELRDGYWVNEYPVEKMNEGIGKNKLIGLHLKNINYSATLVTYRNSYYQKTHPDRSWGIGINRVYSGIKDWNLEAGLMMLNGYRPALVNGNKDSSQNKNYIFTYTLSSEYKLSTSASIIHTLQGDNVHITALKLILL